MFVQLTLPLVTGSQQEQQQAQVVAAGLQLSATVQLVLQLVRYSFGMSNDDMTVLTAHLSPQVLLRLHCVFCTLQQAARLLSGASLDPIEAPWLKMACTWLCHVTDPLSGTDALR